MQEENYDEMTIILVLLEAESIDIIFHSINRIISEFKGNLKILVVRSHFDEESEVMFGFELLGEFRTNRHM